MTNISIGVPRCKIRKFLEDHQFKIRLNLNIKEEIESFLGESLLPFYDNPVTWWHDNHNRFPHLAVLARNYLCIPATQASSERLFSTAGNAVTAKRFAISPEHVEEMCFLHHIAQLA